MGKILVPTDFSDYARNALEFAVAIAKKTGAEIVLYHGYHILADGDYAPIAVGYIGTQLEEQQKLWHNRTAELGEQLAREVYADGQPLKVSQVVKMGTVADDVADLVDAGDYDMIVMGTKGATGLERILFGSVTSAVVDRVKVPVLAVPRGVKYKGFDHIVYGINFDERDIKVIDDLIDFANLFDSQLTCLHITTSAKQLADDKVEIDVLRETYWFTPLDRLNFALRRDESVEKGLEHYLQDHDTDLLAVLRQDRTFWEQLMEHSVSKDLAFHSEVPLLILKK
jgi:nucleotide-binding universal stress UspA family protein